MARPAGSGKTLQTPGPGIGQAPPLPRLLLLLLLLCVFVPGLQRGDECAGSGVWERGVRLGGCWLGLWEGTGDVGKPHRRRVRGRVLGGPEGVRGEAVSRRRGGVRPATGKVCKCPVLPPRAGTPGRAADQSHSARAGRVGVSRGTGGGRWGPFLRGGSDASRRALSPQVLWEGTLIAGLGRNAGENFLGSLCVAGPASPGALGTPQQPSPGSAPTHAQAAELGWLLAPDGPRLEPGRSGLPAGSHWAPVGNATAPVRDGLRACGARRTGTPSVSLVLSDRMSSRFTPGQPPVPTGNPV